VIKSVFKMAFIAGPEHIDQLGHVNNAVWVQWMEQVAVAHWEAVADPNHKDAYFWVVVRHEIDYFRPAVEGYKVTAQTWVDEVPQGARSTRFAEFVGHDGKLCVRSKTQWAIIDKATGRPVRVPTEVIAPFITAV